MRAIEPPMHRKEGQRFPPVRGFVPSTQQFTCTASDPPPHVVASYPILIV